MIFEERTYKNIHYVVYIPNQSAVKKSRVILHLHGTGARGNDIQLIKNIKMFEYALKTNGEFPYIIVSPQCFADSWFDIFEQLQDFVKYVAKEYNAEDYFIAGYSMGAYTSWQLIQTLPDTFKKAILCCGGGAYWSFGRIKTEVFSYHGTADKRVPLEENKKMVDLVNEHGGKAHLTLFPGVEHNCWDMVYLDENTYKQLED
jgi:predicted peptidase